jgi:tetratricopeptide (TPR) repeat protein
MRVFRNNFSLLGLLSLLAVTMLTSGCEFTKKVIAKDKLNQGAIVYNQGRMKEAKEYFREATELIPTNSVAWLYYGTTLYKDFQNMEPGPERDKLGQEVLTVFKRALELAPAEACQARDSAIGYIAQIYNDLKDFDNNRDWLLKRAEGACAKKDVKAQTFYSVGVKYWNCAYDETTRYQDKTQLATDAFHYRNMDYPAALPDKEKALKCVDEGMKYIEKALAEDSEYVDAHFYKSLLYREKQKLTKEEPKRKEYADMAEKIVKQADELRKKKEAQQKAAEEAKAKQG